MSEILPVLILNARPGAGKSELLHGLGTLPKLELMDRFHLGDIHTIDDFPMLWTWFEEDHILEQVFQRDRLHTTPEGYFLYEDLWHLLIRRLSLEYQKWLRDAEPETTVVLEFSRGSEHGGYQTAYQHLSDSILANAASLYIHVSYEESLRKNRARFNPDRPDTILEHGLSDEKLEALYREDDWSEFSAQDPEYLHVRDHRLPYAIFPNEDDVTTDGGTSMLDRLEEVMSKLWIRWQAVH
ncbi:MAG: hypothetical protein ACLFWD_04225 [Anaerolineales bacterium]